MGVHATSANIIKHVCTTANPQLFFLCSALSSFVNPECNALIAVEYQHLEMGNTCQKKLVQCGVCQIEVVNAIQQIVIGTIK